MVADDGEHLFFPPSLVTRCRKRIGGEMAEEFHENPKDILASPVKYGLAYRRLEGVETCVQFTSRSCHNNSGRLSLNSRTIARTRANVVQNAQSWRPTRI